MQKGNLMSVKELITAMYAVIDHKFERFKHFDVKFRQNFKNMLVEEHLKFCGIQKMLDIYGTPSEVYDKLQWLCENHVGESYSSSELKKDISYVAKAVGKGYNFYKNSFKGNSVILFINNERDSCLYRKTRD